MEYIQWQPAFNLGNETIDRQHRHLVDILNETFSLMMAYAENGRFIEKIGELREYAKEHFLFEEELMEKMAYTGLKVHREHHRNFIGELDTLEGKIRKGKKSAPAEVFLFIRDWLLEHIQVTDRGYAVYL